MATLAVLTSLWLGVLASVSPCPLAANLAAFSYIQKEGPTPGKVLISGGFYSAGRMFALALAGSLIISGLLAIPEASIFMQRHMNKIVGPVLLIVGAFVLDLLEVQSSKGISDKLASGKLFRGMTGSFLMGVLFAMAMCPVSAALFFGGLIPLAADSGSKVFLPAMFGLGSALPVTILSVIFSFGARTASRSIGTIYAIQKIIQISSGVILVLTGIYFSLTSTFNLI
ncbi:MAG: aromatic aminobenezylarsenical efflux permease ArsG family transporter [Thermovirgaceae bacterium]|nr:aromatic aminobenezylarsenical efflux permease ArsG family transporter [Thermovirgaceae bacterium]